MTASTSTEILHRLKSLYPKSIDLTLNRPKRLLAELKHPERKLPPVIHFAGTNGKGSTLAMVRAGLEAADQRVHSYISPHLTKFNERIALAGSIIEEDALVDVLLECEAVNRKLPISLFEITTAAAFLAFSRTNADYLLLEVGLGGRLDATNVVDQPELTVITPISIDHEQYLGDTLAKIAFEKAGILKQDIPSVISRQEPEVLEVIENVA
ncbi:MAG: Mur ligase family protein, partial [Rhodobacteraceae bacterium]|nr:Mur ligase family protein [Paracoccaceae bacterium]